VRTAHICIVRMVSLVLWDVKTSATSNSLQVIKTFWGKKKKNQTKQTERKKKEKENGKMNVYSGQLKKSTTCSWHFKSYVKGLLQTQLGVFSKYPVSTTFTCVVPPCDKGRRASHRKTQPFPERASTQQGGTSSTFVPSLQRSIPSSQPVLHGKSKAGLHTLRCLHNSICKMLAQSELN